MEPQTNTHTLTLTNANFHEVIRKEAIVLVDFWAPWCAPCRQIAPIIDQLATDYAGRACVGKVDIAVAANEALATEYGVRSIPALLLFQNGKKKDEVIGAHPDLEKMIRGKLDALLG